MQYTHRNVQKESVVVFQIMYSVQANEYEYKVEKYWVINNVKSEDNPTVSANLRYGLVMTSYAEQWEPEKYNNYYLFVHNLHIIGTTI